MRDSPSDSGSEKGSVLLVAVIVILLLTLGALFSANVSTIESRIAGNNKLGAQTFYITQAGIEEARMRLPAITQVGKATSTWRAYIGGEASARSLFNYDPTDSEHAIVPSLQSDLYYTAQVRHKTEADHGSDLNGDGDTTDVVYWGDENGDGIFEQNTTTGKPVEIITSVGKAGGAMDKITVETYRGKLDLKYAVFGDKFITTKTDGKIWKGSSISPHLASIGSNESIDVRSNALIYGDVDIGKTESNQQGTIADHGGIIQGDGPSFVGRIDPDPLRLFVADSDLNKEFASYGSSNSNSSGASPSISSNAIDLGDSGTMTLRSGNYYLTSIRLGLGAVLTVDVTSGPVNIYLTGPLEAKAGGAIQINPSGAFSGNFTIYSNAVDTSSSPSIDIRNGTTFKGVIYAPHAGIGLYNTGDVVGMVWGNSVDIGNSGDITFDPRLKSKFVSPKYSARCWQEER
jgi:hypothetical protein